MYLNGLTANALAALKIPIVLESDRQAIEVALHTVGQAADARVAIVRSTLDLTELWVSPALLDEVAANPRLELIGPAHELDFGADGRLSVVATPHALNNVMSRN
jgi:hypothetical protein